MDRRLRELRASHHVAEFRYLEDCDGWRPLADGWRSASL